MPASFTKHQLSRPFTVLTRWQRVDADGGNPAIRAFVETADGKDLSLLLVSHGLAVIRYGRKAVSDHPDGRTIGEFSSELQRAESEARSTKHGAWGLSGAGAGDRPAEAIEAADRQALVFNAGRKMKVQGTVSSVGALPGRMTFINFSANREKGGFVGIVREKFLPRFLERFPKGLVSGLTGKRVVLEGTITLYRNIPQIELERPEQINVKP